MAKMRMSMRKTKEILRLKWEGRLSNRQIARSCQVSPGTVWKYVGRAQAQQLNWQTVQVMSEEELDRRLFGDEPGSAVAVSEKPLPDFKGMHEELCRHKSLTLALLWQEYKETHPDGYEISRFCELYQRWKQTLDLVMRQEHKAGEKLFLDYCDGVFIFDSQTHQPVQTQLFVGVWGASNYTYAEATFTQELPNWLKSQSNAFEYFGCVPQITVPDNLKSAVSKACRYEPELNPTYQDFASHYGIAVIPARPYEPRDKAKVEAGVLIVQRWILARLRHFCFFSLAVLNAKIAELLEDLNTRPLRKMKVSRRELFLSLDKPKALSLPEKPFEFASWKKARVNLDYHVEVDSHRYSVPYRFAHQDVEIRFTVSTIEIFRRGTRLASHRRSFQKYGYSTLSEHMPKAHQKHAEWTPARMVQWAKESGDSTATLVEKILASRKHPEQGYRAVLGLFRLGNTYGKQRLEKAAERAIRYKSFSFFSVKNILKRGLDRSELESVQAVLPLHENIRGSQYYEIHEGGSQYVE